MKVRHQIYIIILMLTFYQVYGYSQINGFEKVGTTSFQFLKVIPNARSAAMGGTSASNILSSEAVFFNPAGLTQASHMDMSFSYIDYFLDVNLSSISLAYKVSNIGVFGLQIMMVNYGEIEETSADQLYREENSGTYNPGLTGITINPSSMVVGLTFARDVTDKFGFGITTKYVREDLVKKSAATVAFDCGVIYRTGFRSLKLGTMLRHFGPKVKYFEKSYPLPQTLTIGISGYLLAPEEALLITTSGNKVLLAYDLAQTRDHSQQQHIGIEYVFANILSLRCGYKFNFDEESFTAGLGLKVARFSMDYSYNNFGEYLDNVHRFTLGFAIK